MACQAASQKRIPKMLWITFLWAVVELIIWYLPSDRIGVKFIEYAEKLFQVRLTLFSIDVHYVT